MKKMMENVIKRRTDNPPKEDEDKLLVDVILDIAPSDSQKLSECISFAVGGFHTTGNGKNTILLHIYIKFNSGYYTHFYILAVQKLNNAVKKVIKHRQDNPPPGGEELLIDVLMDNSLTEEQIISDSISYIVGGFHTTSNGRF